MRDVSEGNPFALKDNRRSPNWVHLYPTVWQNTGPKIAREGAAVTISQSIDAISQVIDDLDRPTDPGLDELAARYFGNETVPVRAEFGALSHPGLVRTNNEDHYSVVRRFRSRDVLLTNLPSEAYAPCQDEAFALAVADGVGGAAFGELASMLALRTGWELTGKAFKWTFKLSETETGELLEMMKVYVQLIHRRVQAEAGANANYRGMGTTLTGVLTAGPDAFVVHVGDSRAYLFRQGTLHRLTRDQTMAELMVSVGLIASVDEAAQRFRNTLVSCLGGNFDKVEVETTHVSLLDGDQLLLCTDGLTDMIAEADIAAILLRREPPQATCGLLIDAALAAGGRDNVTVVLGTYAIGG